MSAYRGRQWHFLARRAVSTEHVGMTGRDAELFKDKVEITLNGRQIFYLFFGGAVIASMVFVLGVMVGRRVEARSVDVAGEQSAVRDPLAALDKLHGGGVSELAFPSALRGGSESLGAVDERLSATRGAGQPAGAKATEPKEDSKDEAPAAVTAPAQAKAGSAEVSDTPSAKPKEETAAARAPADDSATAEEDKEEEPVAEDRFTLQIGSFQDRGEADALSAELQTSGYEPYILSAEVPEKGLWFRVRIGRYPSYKAALSAKAAFEKKQQVIAYVTRL